MGEVFIEPGSHRFEATDANGTTAAKEVTVDKGEVVAVSLGFGGETASASNAAGTAPAPGAESPDSTPPPSEAQPNSGPQIVPIVIGGAVALIGVGADNSFGHPSPDVLARLASVPIGRTDRDGQVEVLSDGSSLWLRR